MLVTDSRDLKVGSSERCRDHIARWHQSSQSGPCVTLMGRLGTWVWSYIVNLRRPGWVLVLSSHVHIHANQHC